VEEHGRATIRAGLRDGVLRQFKLRVLLLSVCLVGLASGTGGLRQAIWASHAYNVWLAQLIEKGQAPGLYLANSGKTFYLM